MFHDGGQPQIAGDAAFYERIARETAGPVLEVACGTGRIALALAEAGLDVTGVDLSEGMLTVARRKAEAFPLEQRPILARQDMSALNLDRRFAFVFIAFRSFQHLSSVDLQEETLAGIHRHLEFGGKLALHLFDPRFDILTGNAGPPAGNSGTHPESRHRYVAEVLETAFDHLLQIRRDVWRYREYEPGGSMLREETREMTLRWTYRWELRHLLHANGYAVEAEYSDFSGAGPAYGRELIVVAKRR